MKQNEKNEEHLRPVDSSSDRRAMARKTNAWQLSEMLFSTSQSALAAKGRTAPDSRK
jgi:hypothetical protein